MLKSAVCLAAFALLSAHTSAAQDTELHIICSNGFRAALEKLLPQAERASGHKAQIQFGASRNLKTTIESGQPFDLVILTPPEIIEDLQKDGKIAKGTLVQLATAGIGVGVRAGQPKPDVSTAQAIKKTLLAAKSIGYVKVGAGTPAITAMVEKLGIAQEVAKKTVNQSGAEESMKNLAAGKIDIAMGPVSEIIPAAGVQLAGPFPDEFQQHIILAAAISSSTKNRDAASKFIRALMSPEAAGPIKSAGMEPAAKR
ncbi:MAG TPA: substrate-binding domain-containing protein [Bryobacteraceae bacterium]|nr:substrate-binding domain-containing protein [Bryobacteraceae bacterium]